MSMPENISIKVSKDTKKGLIELGKKDQTYDQIVSGLIQKEKFRTQ